MVIASLDGSLSTSITLRLFAYSERFVQSKLGTWPAKLDMSVLNYFSRIWSHDMLAVDWIYFKFSTQRSYIQQLLFDFFFVQHYHSLCKWANKSGRIGVGGVILKLLVFRTKIFKTEIKIVTNLYNIAELNTLTQ